ncbi:PHP domain-containing protein [Spongisporangium articulatum]|uniref:PHP domain-containing protein n=1 Tax=Spongisporangium articulatum TaxID=3362603 RepID=A0ABW8AQS7_9ACTN
MRIDLHAHSTASDGTESPARVVEVAHAAGLDVLALTDHDTTEGWAEASRAACRVGVTLVPGAEISTQVRGIGVHLLSYLHDPLAPGLRAELEGTRADRVDRARRMVRAMSADLGITWSDVLAQVHGDATVGRPHIADALVAARVVADRDEAFATVLHAGSPYYLPHYAPPAATIVGLVREAGGVPVLAHPRAGKRGRVLSDDEIARLAEAGLGGLEIDHRDHDARERAHLAGLAAELGLLRTGSSDYHGTGKLNAIGENVTAPEVLEAILEQGNRDRLVVP